MCHFNGECINCKIIFKSVNFPRHCQYFLSKVTTPTSLLCGLFLPLPLHCKCLPRIHYRLLFRIRYYLLFNCQNIDDQLTEGRVLFKFKSSCQVARWLSRHIIIRMKTTTLKISHVNIPIASCHFSPKYYKTCWLLLLAILWKIDWYWESQKTDKMVSQFFAFSYSLNVVASRQSFVPRLQYLKKAYWMNYEK